MGLGLGLGGWGWGWVLLGSMGLVVPQGVPQAIRPSKEADGGAAQCSKRTTSQRFQQKVYGRREAEKVLQLVP